MSAGTDPRAVVRNLVDAFERADHATMGLLRRIGEVDYGGADLQMEVVSCVQPAPDLALAMVEVRAQRGPATLHNHAAHLYRVHDGRVVEWWMVEALPAESDAFWRHP